MKIIVKLGLWKLSIAEKIERIRFILLSMAQSYFFPTPTPDLKVVHTHVDNLEAALLKAKGGGAEEIANMRVADAQLDIVVKLLVAYVEGLANADQTNAETIVLSAGMEIKGKGGRTSQRFAALFTGHPGEVLLICPGIVRGVYEIHMCLDPSNELNWQRIYNGTKSRFVVKGLKLGVQYHFRYSVIDASGLRPWSEVKSLYIN